MLTAALALLLSAPPQGLTIRVPRVAAFGASPAEIELVQKAVKAELEAEGYGVVTESEAKGISAVVSGTLTRVGGGYIVNLSIIRQADGRVLDQVREEAKTAADLTRASTDIAKQLASALRLTVGAKAKLKLK